MISGDLEPGGFQVGGFLAVDGEIGGLGDVLASQYSAAGLGDGTVQGGKEFFRVVGGGVGGGKEKAAGF